MTDTDTMPWDVADARAELAQLREEAARLRGLAPRVAELEGRILSLENAEGVILALCGAPEGYRAPDAVAFTLGALQERVAVLQRRLDEAETLTRQLDAAQYPRGAE